MRTTKPLLVSAFVITFLSTGSVSSQMMNNLHILEGQRQANQEWTSRRMQVAQEFRQYYQFLLENCLTATADDLWAKNMGLAGNNYYIAGEYGNRDMLGQMAQRLQTNARNCPR